MSSDATEVQAKAILDIQAQGEEIRRKRLEAAGLSEQFDLWRESMPNTRMDDNEVYNLFMESQVGEESAASGTLSVTTGGEVQTPDTDIPAPGPDEEGGGTDEAGDTSEGGEDRQTDLKLVEGMWAPPPEAESENYEEPSTYQMTQSVDFIKESRTLYDYMYPEGEKKIFYGAIGGGSITGDDTPKQLNDSEIGEWGRNLMSGFNWNVVNTMAMAQRIMTSGDTKLAISFLNMINMYDHSDGSMMDFAGALGEVATDPTTYLGFGVGAVAAKGAAIAAAKTGLKKMIQMGIVGATAGAFEGSMLAGGFDLVKQNIEQEAGARKDIDYGRAGIATGLGAGLGILLGGVGGGWIGRKMDKFAARMAEDKLIMKARDIFLDEGAMLEMGQKEFGEMLGQMLRHEGGGDLTGDLGARLAKAILNKDGSMPMKPDGGVDYKKINATIDRIVDEDANIRSAIKAKQDPSGTLERGGYKIVLGEKGDLLFDLAGMPDKQIDKIQEAADAAGVKVEGDAFRNAPDDQIDVSEYVVVRGDEEAMGKFAQELTGNIIPFPGRRIADLKGKDAPNEPFLPDISDPESQKLAQKIMELEELEKGDVVIRTEGRPGSRVIDELGERLEVVGRTKNGWYKVRDQLGRERNLRRKQFEVIQKAPRPRRAGPMELDPFSDVAAKIIEMNETALSPEFKLRASTTTHKMTRKLSEEMREVGIDITNKPIASYWTEVELDFLRNTYDHQAQGMAELAKQLTNRLRNEGRLRDSELAEFNNAHSIFVATRDLFYGVSGNAGRQLNILRMKPTQGVYDFSQSLLDSISIQGGRANTERAIKLMAEFADKKHIRGKEGRNLNKQVTDLSQNIWGSPKAAALLNVRYNMMLSSWRTHFYNFLGNSASGVYQHLMVSPVRMGINNLVYARELAWSKLAPGTKYGEAVDPAVRMTRHNYYAELRGHFAGARDSWMLAKEIAMGRDIGEGKVWNELGLRYNVINVPDSAFGKLGTTPVRLLEAGDAFFKNQYYNSKMHEQASIAARWDEVHGDKNYQKRYQHYLDNPEELGPAAERTAKDFAAKQTYTNDPNVYGGILAAVAQGVSSMQNKSLAVNMIIPFVRTPANLLSYSMEMIGANILLSPPKTYQALMHGTQRESQEALARLTVAAGLWLVVQEAHQNGQITGTGPSNWEERQVWMAAGWQPNSIKVWDHWVSMERAAPAGLSLATMASVFDYYSMIEHQNKPAMEWMGAGLLYTADMILDESYISSATDILTAISSKETGRFQSVGASMINSIFIPNLLRDLRRPADEAQRSTTGVNLLDQMHKQMMNATPGFLDIGQGSSWMLPPKRDWKGDVVNYWGNAYQRGLIPFNVRNPEDADAASMALAYARIPVSKPNRTIAWPGGMGDSIDLFAMDEGQGFVYDEYLRIVGKRREQAINELMKTKFWKEHVRDGDIGPGTEGDRALRKAMSIGSKFGRKEMLNFLIEHSGDNNTYKRTGSDGKEIPYIIHHSVDVKTYIELQKAVRNERINVPEDQDQYIIQKPTEGPEFFKP